jgi:superfamily II DNA/RNA helicase
MMQDDRRAAIERFTSGAARVLLATDAAGEGLNLQAGCRIVVNLELPWNPTRLEQRIGRVDRIGQRRTVHAFHLIARGTGESRLLLRLERRVAQARADVGAADPLGFTDERAVVRQMVIGSRRMALATTSIDGADPAMPPAFKLDDEQLPSRQTPTLAEEAGREVSRLAAARAFTKAGDARALAALEAGSPWLARTRQWRTRARLGGRTLTLWRIAAVDGRGTRFASTIVGAAMDEWRDDMREHVRARVEQASRAWRERAADTYRTFVAARIGRKQSAPREETSSRAFQPGLFDRRTERARLAIAAAERGRNDGRSDAIATVEAASTVTFPPAELLLILTP